MGLVRELPPVEASIIYETMTSSKDPSIVFEVLNERKNIVAGGGPVMSEDRCREQSINLQIRACIDFHLNIANENNKATLLLHSFTSRSAASLVRYMVDNCDGS